jgi:hypothetical protein
MQPLLITFLASCGGTLALAAFFHAVARLGSAGRAFCDWCAKAPALDLVVFLFTHGPWIAGLILWKQWGMATLASFAAYAGVTVAGQAAALLLWSWAHELANLKHRSGPRIVKTLNRRVGFTRNHVAVWWTALAVPVFTLVRIAELIIYPPLVWIIHLPRYRMGEWINVSRQKFTGLVGYDLIWCLYCDWMTGVWSLGTEMLRNIESFWCPIRFANAEKCENCKIDFPDVAHAWVPANATMTDVVQTLEKHYPGPPDARNNKPSNKPSNAWFGHPVRLTVKGKATSNSP